MITRVVTMLTLSSNACRSLIALFILINSLPVSAQKEPVIWFFGDHNGIDFRSGSPVATTNPNVSLYGKRGTWRCDRYRCQRRPAVLRGKRNGIQQEPRHDAEWLQNEEYMAGRANIFNSPAPYMTLPCTTCLPRCLHMIRMP